MFSLIRLERIVDHYSVGEPCYLQMIATATLLQYEQGELPDWLIKGTINLLKEKINDLLRNEIPTSITGIKRFPHIPMMLSTMTVKDDERYFFDRLGFMEVQKISYQQLGMDVSRIPEKLRSKYRRAGCYCVEITSWNETFVTVGDFSL